jgi:hypothetical protein
MKTFINEFWVQRADQPKLCKLTTKILQHESIEGFRRSVARTIPPVLAEEGTLLIITREQQPTLNLN